MSLITGGDWGLRLTNFTQKINHEKEVFASADFANVLFINGLVFL